MRVGWPLSLCVVLGWVAGISCKSPSKTEADARPAVEKSFAGVTCLDLSGAPRRSLMLGAEGRLYFTEASRSSDAFRLEHLRWDLVSVDRAGKDRKVHVQDTSSDVRFAGPDRVVFRRPMPAPLSTSSSSSTSILMSASLSKAEEGRLSEGVSETYAYVVDVEHQLVYFTAHPEGALVDALYRSPLAGGAPTKVGDAAVSPVRLVDGGKTLLGAGRIGETVNFSRSGVDGSGTRVLLPVRPYDEAFVGDMMIFVDRGKEGAVMAMPLGGTADDAKKVPGAANEDELVHGRTLEGEPLFLQHKEEEGGFTLLTVSSSLEASPFARVPLPVDSAVTLPANAVAALFLQDSGGANDGKEHYADEADLCIVGASRVMLDIPMRKVPLVIERGKQGLDAIARDLGEARMKAIDATTAAFVTKGVLPGSLDDLRTRLAATQKAAADATKDPRFGVVLVDEVTHRHAVAVWNETRAAIDLRVGGHDVMLPNPADFTITAETTTTLDTGSGKRPFKLTCSGVVKSTGAAEVALDAECSATARTFATPSPRAIKRASLGKLAPAGTAKYSIDLGRFELPPVDIQLRFLDGVHEVPFLDTLAMDDGADWIAMLDRIAAGPGFTLQREGDALKAAFDARVKHATVPKVDVPAGFGAFDAKKQGELATALWKEWSAHAKKLHGSEQDIELYEPGKSSPSWVVERGKLTPYPRP